MEQNRIEASDTTIFAETRERLIQGADQKYQEFHSSLVPGEEMAPILGCRVPFLRSLGKEIAKRNGRQYIQELAGAGPLYYEELVLWGVIIAISNAAGTSGSASLMGLCPRLKTGPSAT